MEQSLVESIVRLTVRLSAVCFVAALLLFAAGARHRRDRVRYALRALVGFLVAHTLHFAAVVWLAALTAGENIHARGGWTVALAVAALFYASGFGILHVWRSLTHGAQPPAHIRVAAHVGTVLIAAVFLNSYIARVERMPVYWVPALLMIGTVAFYFWQGQASPTGLGASTPERQ